MAHLLTQLTSNPAGVLKAIGGASKRQVTALEKRIKALEAATAPATDEPAVAGPVATAPATEPEAPAAAEPEAEDGRAEVLL